MLLEDDGTPMQGLPTRRRSPPSSFPPQPSFHYGPSSSSSGYTSIPRSDYTSSYGYGRNDAHRAFDFDSESDVGYERGGPWDARGGGRGAWDTLVGLRHQRNRYKLLIGVAGAALLYLVYDALSRHHHGPPWRHGRFPPPPPFEGWPPPPPPPPPTTDSSTTSSAADAQAPSTAKATSSFDVPTVDLASYIQPRRPVPPTSPDPWAAFTEPSFRGREYLSSSRFGSSTEGWKMTSDPPERDPPPARFLLKAFEYAASVAGRRADGSKEELNPGMGYDAMTGRPKKVPHEVLKLGKEEGWKIPLKGFRVDELGEGKFGEKEVARVQVEESEVERDGGREEEMELRRDWVKRAFMHAWSGYSKYAYGHDEVSPVSNLHSNNYNGWGATLVDSLDTLLLMNLTHEYNLARKHVADIDFSYLVPSGSRTFSTELPDIEDMNVKPFAEVTEDEEGRKWVDPRLRAAFNQHSPSTLSWFETLIRYLGSLLSAHELSGGDPLMLQRATELGDFLLPAFATKHGLAMARYTPGYNPDGQKIGRTVLAEVGSCILEMTKLSQLTGDPIYYEAAQRSVDTLDKHFKPAVPPPSDPKKAALARGRLGTLLPAHIDPNFPNMLQGEYTWGGLADSWYEYLIKQAQLTSFSLPQYPRLYASAVDSAQEHLIRRIEVVPGREDLTIVGNKDWGTWKNDLQHLTCFAGGMLGLGSRLLARPHDFETGVNVTNACVWVYESSETGVGGETTSFYGNEEGSRWAVVDAKDGSGPVRAPRGSPTGVRSGNRKQIGRPETIESVFYMYRLTGDRKWQDQGWTMFVNWVRHAITESGFATIRNVHSAKIPAEQEDSMESFVLGETLKYYYLLFSPLDFMSLDEWVFSTEAHPFWIPKPGKVRSPVAFWEGPEEEEQAGGAGGDFVEQMGEGTWVQKWARVQQAAALASGTKKAGQAGGQGQRGGAAAGGGGRNFVRPSEEEIQKARKAAAEKAGPIRRGGAAAAGGMGGGRGMGGGGGM
ncbi:hypothetical protein JCM8547_006161 [Rhodosporidiobolus lusitaniae]